MGVALRYLHRHMYNMHVDILQTSVGSLLSRRFPLRAHSYPGNFLVGIGPRANAPKKTAQSAVIPAFSFDDKSRSLMALEQYLV